MPIARELDCRTVHEHYHVQPELPTTKLNNLNISRSDAHLHGYIHEHNDHANKEIGEIYGQMVPEAVSRHNQLEPYESEQREQYEQYSYPQSELEFSLDPTTFFHNEQGGLGDDLFLLAAALQHFHQSVARMSLPNISAWGQNTLAMHLEQILRTTNMNFPVDLINNAASLLHMLIHNLQIDTTDAVIPQILSSVPFIPVKSCSNNPFTTPGTSSLPSFQSNIMDILVTRDFEEFFSSPHIPPHIQARLMPQQTYSSRAKADHSRYVKDADLKSPVIFRSRYCDHIGISLNDALGARIKDVLTDPYELVLDHGPPSAYIRLRVPGYALYKKQRKQISLKTFEKPRNPLTKARVIRSVANAVKKILENLAKEQQNCHYITDLPFKWTVGNGTNQIGTHNLFIASLHNVSQGTWQPHLYLDPNYPMSH